MTQDIPLEKAAYSISETARSIGIGRSMIYELIKEGRLRTVKIGRRTLVPAPAISELLDSLAGEGA